jgi:protein-tyrosine phosphatase
MRLRPFSILQVCMGNICRSPMAERLLVCAARVLVEALGKARSWSISGGRRHRRGAVG